MYLTKLYLGLYHILFNCQDITLIKDVFEQYKINIADSLFMSKNTLAKNFRREVGIPIGKYIDKQVFFEAEILLTKSSMSVKEISGTLGFCDQF